MIPKMKNKEIKLNNNALNLTYEKLIEKDYTSETQTKKKKEKK